MATPVRRIRPVNRTHSFDLRSTALLFGLLAVVISMAGFAGKVALGVVEQRPVLAVVLCLVGLPVAAAVRRNRRRFSARTAARRAVAALDEATAVLPDVEDAAAGYEGVDHEALGHETPAQGAVVHEAYEAVDYDALDADEFEQAIAALCERDGCADVEVVGGAGDLGADVTATAADGRRIVIQCKRYCDTNKVGSQDLQRFGGTCFTVHEAQVAIVVTTSDFTAPAAEYAEQCGILCVDRETLRAWSEGVGPEPWADPTCGV
ncbi:restriction endonuclease [Streptomyces sp. NPDC058371]|uniref:restriction endonuclease n=1 Tax=Streptomyces sp. NPDC058371 TaxID=3346463 RepID=UPI0036541FCD